MNSADKTDWSAVNRMSRDIGEDAALQLNWLSKETGLRLEYEIEHYGPQDNLKVYMLYAMIGQHKLEVINDAPNKKNLERTIRTLRGFYEILKQRHEDLVDYRLKQDIHYLKFIKEKHPDMWKEILEK